MGEFVLVSLQNGRGQQLDGGLQAQYEEDYGSYFSVAIGLLLFALAALALYFLWEGHVWFHHPRVVEISNFPEIQIHLKWNADRKARTYRLVAYPKGLDAIAMIKPYIT